MQVFASRQSKNVCNHADYSPRMVMDMTGGLLKWYGVLACRPTVLGRMMQFTRPDLLVRENEQHHLPIHADRRIVLGRPSNAANQNLRQEQAR